MGPLHGVRVIEFAGIGPGPFCAMLLSDMGADVIRIDRPVTGRQAPANLQFTGRGRRSIALYLKRPAALDAVKRLLGQADALIEGYRPGVMERLGLGPDVVAGVRPSLVYGRMTGWGQTGPLAQAAGHDLNYIALSGALHAIGPAGGKPVPPLNLVGDYGGGGMYLAFGLVCAILEARGSGLGQVVDAAMVDGATALMTPIYQAMANGRWQDRRGSNFLDSGAPWYDTYETKDGRHIAIGAIEPQFYALLLDRLGLSAASLPPQNDPSGWPVLRARFAETFLTRDRDAWVALLEGTDACLAPVLSMQEAASHPHLAARGVFLEVDGLAQPGPAPRFSRTAATVRGPAPEIGADGSAILAAAGFSQTEIDAAISTG